jgi:16S rRNA G1207 methylase RsmC
MPDRLGPTGTPGYGMIIPEISRWRVADPENRTNPGTGSVIFCAPTPTIRPAGGHASVWFHDAMGKDYGRAMEVELWLPTYRGNSLVPVLGWLVTGRLAHADAQVTWWLGKRQGPDSIARMLDSLGWQRITRTQEGRYIRLVARPPGAVSLPDPACFIGSIGKRSLTFEADYGVFSSKGIDAGTALLADVAMSQSPVEVVADIGIGYGALAIGMVVHGVAKRAVATDIDSVALWLAGRNALRHGVDLSMACTGNPLDVPPTPLTLCNFPTHIDVAASRLLMAGLIRRARSGRLLIVVHKSLESRYASQLTEAGLAVNRHVGSAHIVLDAHGRRSDQ